MIELKLFNYLDRECENKWKIFEKNAFYNYFQTFEYISNLTTFSKNNIKIIFIYFDKELAAILPFEIRFFFGLKILQWIGNDRSDYCNPLISEKFINHLDNSKFTILWDRIKKKIGNFDLIFLNNQISKISNIENPFVKFLKNIKQTKIYKIQLSNHFDNYLNSIKKKDKNHAYELHRVNLKYKKLKKIEGEVNFEISEIKNNLNDFNLIFYSKLKQLDLKKEKHSLDKDFFNLYKKLISNNSKHYYLAKFIVKNEIISACLLIIFKNTLYYYLPVTLSNKFNRYKPGKILITSIINWAIIKKIKFFDFGLGEEGYKRHFSNVHTFVQKYLFYNSLKGKIIYFILKFIIFFRY